MEELVSLCKRRGLIFQSAEIYGGIQGVYDYGPLGVELKNNIKSSWWSSMVYESDNIEGSRLLRDVDTRKFIRHWKIIYFFCLGISFIGLGILLTIIYPLTYVDELQSEPANLIRSSARNVIFIVLGLFVFFVLNAYAPSL